MKKILFTLLISLCLLPVVKADESTTTIDLMEQDYIKYSNVSSYEGCVSCGIYLQDKYIYNNWTTFYADSTNRTIFNNLYQELTTVDISNYAQSAYLSVLIFSKSSEEFDLFGIIITLSYGYGQAAINIGHSSVMYFDGTYYSRKYVGGETPSISYIINDSYFYPYNAMIHPTNANPFIVGTGDFSSTWFYLPTTNFISYPIKYSLAENTVFNIYNKDSELINTVTYASELPYIYKSGEFDPSSQYTTVNLDDYEYVILSLKDYSQTKAFSSTLKVKGMVGITPVYEFGTVEKTNVTDRCNASYSDFTDYGLYILKSDLTNNAVYYVKSCEDGSAFKFDNTMFDISYITADTVDDPVITVGGNTYQVIPFNKLSTTANSNEENNFVPGQSGSSLTDIIDNTSDFASGIWDSVSSFMGLATKFFNTLPAELRSIVIMGFTVLVTIAVIKFIRG